MRLSLLAAALASACGGDDPMTTAANPEGTYACESSTSCQQWEGLRPERVGPVSAGECFPGLGETWHPGRCRTDAIAGLCVDQNASVPHLRFWYAANLPTERLASARASCTGRGGTWREP